jgi:hypothetical protein
LSAKKQIQDIIDSIKISKIAVDDRVTPMIRKISRQTKSNIFADHGTLWICGSEAQIETATKAINRVLDNSTVFLFVGKLVRTYQARINITASNINIKRFNISTFITPNTSHVPHPSHKAVSFWFYLCVCCFFAAFCYIWTFLLSL